MLKKKNFLAIMVLIMTLIITFIMTLTFTACTKDTTQLDDGNGENSSGAPVGGGNNNNDDNNSSNGGNGETVNPDASILIAYFSWSGHTRQLAEVIQEQTGGDLFEITLQIPHTEDINVLSGQALQELNNNVRPELATHIDNFADYDVIFVGYPNWWSNAPMPVFTFLEEYDFSGKTVVPFSVYGSSVWGNSISSIKSTLPTAMILDGYCVQEHAMQNINQEVATWLKGIGFIR